MSQGLTEKARRERDDRLSMYRAGVCAVLHCEWRRCVVGQYLMLYGLGGTKSGAEPVTRDKQEAMSRHTGAEHSKQSKLRAASGNRIPSRTYPLSYGGCTTHYETSLIDYGEAKQTAEQRRRAAIPPTIA